MVTHWSRGRKIDIVILAIYVGSLLLMAIYIHRVDHRNVARICQRVEQIKAQLVLNAQASDTRLDSLAGELGPSVIKVGHDLNRKAILRFAPKECPKP